MVPETKSVPLDRMDRLFEIKPIRSAQPKLMEELARDNMEVKKFMDTKGEEAPELKEKR